MNIEIKITDRTNVAFPIIIKDKKGNEIYQQWEDGGWYKRTFDENGNPLTYKDSNGFYQIKGKKVTKEEYEAFVNGTPEYTMEELVAKLGHNFKIKK
jgi:hypothetical protein